MAKIATRANPKPVVVEEEEARGRGPNPENKERLAHILARAKEEPGVSSPEMARELGITTLQCSQLTNRLVHTGELEVFKLANGVRTNYLPKDLAKLRARLEKQRDIDLAERATKVNSDKAGKFEKLKEAAAAKKAAAKAAAAPATPVEEPKALPRKKRVRVEA